MSTNVQVQMRQVSRGKSKSSSWSSSSRGKGKSTPSFFKKTMQRVSSTHTSSSKRRRVNGFSDGDVEAPLTRKDISVIVNAVMDAMPGASTHQPMEDMDTVERLGELDVLCCKNSFAVTILHPCAGSQVKTT